MKHRGKFAIGVSLALAILCAFAATDGQAAITCDATNTITANVVVLDSPTVFNRLGAQNPNWITYALRRDVVFQNRLNAIDPLNGTPITQVG